MILFYNRMIAPERKRTNKIYLTTSNPYDHWLKKLYIFYNKKI